MKGIYTPDEELLNIGAKRLSSKSIIMFKANLSIRYKFQCQSPQTTIVASSILYAIIFSKEFTIMYVVVGFKSF